MVRAVTSANYPNAMKPQVNLELFLKTKWKTIYKRQLVGAEGYSLEKVQFCQPMRFLHFAKALIMLCFEPTCFLATISTFRHVGTKKSMYLNLEVAE